MDKKDVFSALAKIKPGHTIGRHRVLYVLGRGSLGVTCKVVNVSSRKVSVMKIIPEVFCLKDDMLAVMKDIGKLNSDLKGASNLLFINDVELHTGVIALHLDLPTGIVEDDILSLSLQRLKRNRGYFFTEKEILFTSFYILKGLKNLHEAGVCHGNLKPRNIFFDDGKVLLADFGLQYFFDGLSLRGEENHTDSYTNYGPGESQVLQGFYHSHVASYRHQPCESWGNQSGSIANDLFAAGVIISELVLRHEHYTGMLPSESCQGIQPQWDDWITKSTHPDASKRFASADEMIESMPPPLDKPSSYSTIFDSTLIKQNKEFKENSKDNQFANKLRKSVAETKGLVASQNNTRTVFKIKRKN